MKRLTSHTTIMILLQEKKINIFIAKAFFVQIIYLHPMKGQTWEEKPFHPHKGEKSRTGSF